MFKTLVFKIKKAQEYLNKHWFKAGLFFMCCYVLLNKDISFHISMQNGSGNANNTLSHFQTEQGTAPAAQLNGLNIGSAIGGIVKKVTAPIPSEKTYSSTVEKKSSKAEPAKKDNKANHFHNISSIISPIYLKNKGLDAAEIQQMKNICKAYVKRFAPVAQSEMKKYGIPASIKLAQALLESDAGHSRLARANNNHFGMKCFARRCKKSHCSNFTDDTHKDFFRKYSNVWESYRAHSKLVSGKRYQHLKKLDSADYKNWAYGLRKAGYATDKRYAEKLIEIIEELKLEQYDK